MKKKKTIRGFTLIELAVVMIIFSTIVGIVAAALSAYTAQQKRDYTIESLDDSTGALIEVGIIMGFLPCPAPLNAAEGDADYGISDCDHSDVKRILGRDADGDGNKDAILIGAVPIKTLEELELSSIQITGKDAYDGYGYKLTYAVSEQLAYDDTTFPLSASKAPQTGKREFDESLGIIDVIDEFGNTILEPEKTAHFVLVSHGKNGKGAYNKKGDCIEKCTVSLTDPTLPEQDPDTMNPDPDESENCDNNDIRFLSGLHSRAKGYYNDDTVKFQNLRMSTLWSYTRSQEIPAQDPNDPPVEISRIVSTSPSNVGVGTETPIEKIHISGDVLATKIMSLGICDEDGNKCMSAESIAGNDPNMTCSEPNQAIRVIQNNEVICVDIFEKIVDTCPDGKAACGLSNTNGILCRPIDDPDADCE